MYAIIRTGGRQFRAEEGAQIDVEKLPYEIGDTFEIDEVLLLADDDDITVGQPLVKGAKVEVTVLDQFRAKKVIVWKYKSGNRYRRKKGHRHYYTRLRVDKITPA